MHFFLLLIEFQSVTITSLLWFHWTRFLSRKTNKRQIFVAFCNSGNQIKKVRLRWFSQKPIYPLKAKSSLFKKYSPQLHDLFQNVKSRCFLIVLKLQNALGGLGPSVETRVAKLTFCRCAEISSSIFIMQGPLFLCSCFITSTLSFWLSGPATLMQKPLIFRSVPKINIS